MNDKARPIKTKAKSKRRTPRCTCCGRRARDPYDPEGRCGHSDCIPF